MKSVSILVGSLFIYSNLSQAAVENLVSLQREPGGTFSVVCDTKGVVTQNTGVIADAIRGNSVCEDQIVVGSLEEGPYISNSDFCGQSVQWMGTELHLILALPCAGTLTMTPTHSGWYRGKLDGFDYDYEVQVKGPTNYIFYSRSFSAQGEFVFSSAKPSSGLQTKQSPDPAGI